MYDIVKFSRKLARCMRAENEDGRVDGTVFQLHCHITSALLLLASAAVSTKQFIGAPMQCLFGGFNENSDHVRVAETFCWNNSTFTTWTEGDETRITYHAYYQWVYFVLVFQAILFHLPKFIWAQWEGNLMKHLKGTDAEDLRITRDPDTRAQKKNELAKYLVQRLEVWKTSDCIHICQHLMCRVPHISRSLGIPECGDLFKDGYYSCCTQYLSPERSGIGPDVKTHTWYTIVYWCCEFSCLVNVVVQVLALDRFLNGEGRFLTYGWSALKLQESESDLVDNVLNFPGQTVMDRIFPLKTSCIFNKFGPSGDLQSLEALCILEINSYNRYIFLFMWYWFLLLIILLISLLVFRIATMFSARLRSAHLRTPGKKFLRKEISCLVDHLSISDWWVLYSLKCNMNSIFFEDLVLTLFDRLKLGPRKASTVSDCATMLLSKDIKWNFD